MFKDRLINAFGHSIRVVNFLALLVCLTPRVESAPAQNQKPLPKSLAGASVSPERLRKAVADSEAKLGSLTPAQKKIFDEEVLTQPQRFVRDYRASAKGIDADVDWISIKNYLSFHASQVAKNPGAKAPALWYWVGAEPGCLKCAHALPLVKKMIGNRLENRGFRALDGSLPVNTKAATASAELDGVPDADSGNETQRIAALQIKTKKAFEISARTTRETSLKEISERWTAARSAAGVLYVYLRLAPQDDVDSVHAEEKRYLTLMHFSTSAERLNGSYGFSSEFESLENDPIDQSVLRLSLDAMTELGAQAMKQIVKNARSSSDSNENSAEGPSLQLKISSVQSYGHYARARSEIQSALQDLPLRIREREFSRGQAIWILHISETGKTPSALHEEVKKRVGGIAKEKLKVSSIQSSERVISVELAR